MTQMNKERKKKFLTSSQIEVNEVYTHKDLLDLDPEDSLGRPGEFPFTRGPYSNMYRGKLWTMRQYAGFATVEETNRHYKYLYQEGNTGFSIAFHLPTQVGYDSDHPMALGEVGRCGVAIDSLKDMEELWDGIPLANVSTSMTINSTAPVLDNFITSQGK